MVTTQYSDLPINEQLKKNILEKGYTHLTPIQDGAIPHILAGKDLIGLANTGTGKTAAFSIPLLDKLTRTKGEKILIIAPTRELALQIQKEIRSFSRGLRIYDAMCVGGANINYQIRDLRRNPQVVIGTPGRIKDLILRKELNTSQYNNVVLDEVDRMLDMGFIRDIQSIFEGLPDKRHSLFFSATMTKEIEKLIYTFSKDPVQVCVRTDDTTNNVDQDIVRISNGMNKITVLVELLQKKEFKKVLIFGRTKYGVERLSKTLYKEGFKTASIHGNKPQSKRNQAIRLFQEDHINILVATDVASRGIDITDITHVINYDQPSTHEDYIHRIGRTGRANKKGFALTFV